MKREYYAITPFNLFIKLNAHTQKEAVEVLKDANFKRPEFGIDFLGYIDTKSKGYMVFCFNTKTLVPKRVRRL